MNVRKIRLSLVTALMSVAFPLSAQVHGRVFVDTNVNGVLDAGETGMSRVAVQDGLTVVLSDDRGNFSLPAGEGCRFITMTVPSGYQAVTDHFLLYDPDRKEYNLALKKSKIDPRRGFTFLHITDTESSEGGQWVDDLKNYAASSPTSFIIHTGDICYQPGIEFHGANIRSTQMGTPMYYCVGNHDLVKGSYGEALWQKTFGPSWYSFEVGDCHFVVTPMLGGDYAPSYKRADVLRWMKNDLSLMEPGKKVVLFNHDLWFQNNNFVFQADGDSIDLAAHNLKAFIYGHWHVHFFRPDTQTGIATYCSSTPDKGGIDHSPSCFRAFHVDALGRISSETRYNYVQDQLTVVYPNDGQPVYVDGGVMTVRVNAYKTESAAKAVRMAVMRNGAAVKWTDLSPDTDWAWSGLLQVDNADTQLAVEAEFENGTRLAKQIGFRADGRKPMVKGGSEWTNLVGNAAHNQQVDLNPSFPLAVNWVRNVGSNIFMVAPVISDGKVYTATIDDDRAERCLVLAYDLATGEQRWKMPAGNSIKNSIACDGARVFAANAEGVLFAIDGETGKWDWAQKVTEPMLPALVQGIAVDKGIVYAGQGKWMSAVSILTGKPIWTNDQWDMGEGTTSTITVGGGVVLASAHWRGLYAHDTQTGKLLWSKTDDEFRFRDGSASFYDGRFYLASSGSLFVIEANSGKILQSEKTNYKFHSASVPVVTAKLIVVATSDNGVVAFDRQSMKEAWHFVTGPALFYTSPYTKHGEATVEVTPIRVGSSLFFGASDGFFYAVDLQTGACQWKYNMGAPVFSSAAVSGNCLLVSDFSGNLYNFSLKK